MEPNQYGQLLLQYPQVFYQGYYYLAYQDFIEMSGLPKTTLHRIIKVIPDVPKISIKNRTFYRIDFCIKYHRWAKGKNG